MIHKIGIIYQGPNDLGFLQGLRRRLRCEAELIPAISRGRTRISIRRQASKIWLSFRKARVDLVVRLTDADTDRWQDVKREEERRFPQEARSVLVCGVATRNLEHWLVADPGYAKDALGLGPEALATVEAVTGNVKAAISQRRKPGEGHSDVVERLVIGAPPDVFQRWLQNESLGVFYDDCRAAARRENCQVPNECNE